MTLGVI